VYISGSKKQPYARMPPLSPRPFSPSQSPGGERGPSGGRGFRREALGIRGTAKQPYALGGTFCGWWMIQLRSLELYCFWNPWRYLSRTTASRTLRAASAFMSVYQRSGLVYSSEYWCTSAVQKTALRAHAPSIPPPFLPQSKPWERKGAKRGQALGVGL